MALNRILLFYISVNSGHQMAAMAIEDAIRIVDRNVETLNINHFHYTNPVLAKLIMKGYHGMLRKTPELWDYLYDNNVVREKTSKLMELVYKLNTIKIHRLIQWYKPELIVCTQAFPCVAMAEYKRTRKVQIPLVGVVTDYGIHSYWVDKDINLYIVPTVNCRDRLVQLGVDSKRIEVHGIPISPRFSVPLEAAKIRHRLGINGSTPVVLIMGGSRGMISIDEIVEDLARLPEPLHLLAICGANRSLYRRLQKLQGRCQASISVFSYVSNIEELMSIADVMVTKPGGLTITESLSKKLPLIIINPIPGQEAKNTEFLINNQVAIKANDSRDVSQQVSGLLGSARERESLRQRINNLGVKNAGLDIAKRVIYWEKC